MNAYSSSDTILNAGIPSIAFSLRIINYRNLEGLDQFVNQEVLISINKYADLTLKEVNVIDGYHILHKKYGKKSKKITPAPEALIKMLMKRGSIPRIAPLVDIYNLVSIKYALALGAHDLEHVRGDIILRFAEGGEIFVPLGATAPEQIWSGEYGYFENATNEVLCRLEARQCERTKITMASKEILIIIQGNECTPSQYLFDAKAELINNLKLFIEFTICNEFDFTLGR